MNNRNIQIDAFKGFAIIAVVFYHLGLLPYGYLGVDIFLVVNGYFITRGIMNSYERGDFSDVNFLANKVARLWPPVILAGLICLPIAYFTMLPDDMENLSQSIVASNFFGNNILASITTKNYWNVVNAYKPLMHFWYVGILMQCYIVYPLFFMLTNKVTKNFNRAIKYVLIAITAISLVLYILPTVPDVDKFYSLVYRMFEIAAGGVVAVYLKGTKNFKFPNLVWLSWLVVLALCCIKEIPGTNITKVVIVCLFSVLGVICSESNKDEKPWISTKTLAIFGVASYSIFVWHQVIFAFYRYAVNSQPALLEVVFLIAGVALVSCFSYRFIENPLNTVKTKSGIWKVNGITAIVALITTASSLFLYSKAGVVRDIPELDVYANNIHRGMHAEYCDRVYKMDVPFKNNGRIKVLAIGNSFARDWVNILLESELKDSLDISYIYSSEKFDNAKALERIKEADFVFIRGLFVKKMNQEVQEYLKNKPNVYGIGTKAFGETNGNIYSHRHSDDYFGQRAMLPSFEQREYRDEKKYWGENYIDFIAPLVDNNKTMPVFTDDKKYISQDCRHLTRSGAQYYCRIFDLANIFVR